MDDKYKDQAAALEQLGAKKTDYTRAPSVEILETFPNRDAGGEPYKIEFVTSEFTSLCPKTGQPDYSTVRLRYVPGEKCIESKSLKLYIGSYRNEGQFMEAITNQMLQHFVEACQPHAMVLEMDFNARGGIGTRVEARYLNPMLDIVVIGDPLDLDGFGIKESDVPVIKLRGKIESLLGIF